MFKGFICCESCTLKNRRALPLKFPSFLIPDISESVVVSTVEESSAQNHQIILPSSNLLDRICVITFHLTQSHPNVLCSSAICTDFPCSTRTNATPPHFKPFVNVQCNWSASLNSATPIQQSPLPKFHFVNGLLH